MFDHANNFSNTCVVIEDLVQHILQNHATFVSITRNATAQKHLSFFIFFLFSFMKIVIRGYDSWIPFFSRFHSPLWWTIFHSNAYVKIYFNTNNKNRSQILHKLNSILNNLISCIMNIFQSKLRIICQFFFRKFWRIEDCFCFLMEQRQRYITNIKFILINSFIHIRYNSWIRESFRVKSLELSDK